jgi:hypothetical protein
MLQPPSVPTGTPLDSQLVASLAKLWPHREHESNSLKHFLCSLGLHRWRQLDLSELYPEREVRYCFWCPKIRVDGVIHTP